MSRPADRILYIALAAALASGAAMGARLFAGQLPLSPLRDSGQSVTAAYEGWYRNPDGSKSLLIGYFNRNAKQTLDIPVGPENRVEPGGPDQGQPTHFLPRRQWGVFSIRLPADFGDKKLTWTIVANGQTTEIPMGLDPLWEVEPFRESAQGNTPPSLRFEQKGTIHQGPPQGMAASLTGAAGAPVTLTAWAIDDGQLDPDRKERAGGPVAVAWSKFRGPGAVTFAEARPKVGADGLVTTTAIFAEAGDYVLRLQANDVSGEGGGGFQCCWTNAHVLVRIKAAGSMR